MESSVERRHPDALCEDCSLYGRGRFVPSVLPERPSLAIVGEAPGAQEATRGIPFTGPSGKLLDLVLEHHGIERASCVLTNAVLCRPRNNDTPSKDDVAACRPRLLKEITESQVDTVVVLGNTAARSILDTRIGITELRKGPGRSSARLPNKRIIPTIHPAAALRHSDSFPDIVTDLGKVVTKDSKHIPLTSWAAYSGEEAIMALKELKDGYAGKPVAVDIESGIEKDGAGGFEHPSRHKLLCIGFSWAAGKALVIDMRGADEHLESQVRDVLQSILIIAQNGKFDLEGLYSITKGTALLWFDTMLAHYCLDERPGHHDLESMCSDYLGAPQWKDDLKKHIGPGGNYASIPPDILHLYNADDTSNTYQLAMHFIDALEHSDMRRAHDFLVAASNQLIYPELNGVGIDLEYVDKLDREYEESLAQLRSDILNHTGVAVNPNSPKQVKEWLESVGIRVPATDKENMIQIIESDKVPHDHPAREYARLHIKFKGESKQHGTYVKGTKNRLYAGRVYTTYLLHGSVTGRLASRNPNLQNITRDAEGRPSVRRIYVPTRDDNVFVQSDYGQAELRVMAAESGDVFLREIFESGRHIHKEFSTQLYGVGYNKEQYIRTKAFVFGIAYDRGARSIADEYGLPLHEAVKIHGDFLGLMPELIEWRQGIKAQVRRNKMLETRFGRRRRFWLITRENQNAIMREALAFVPQSTASDICLSAAVELRQTLRGVAYLRLLVHDSILFECHHSKAAFVKDVMEETMIRHGQLVCPEVPWAVDTGIGKSWADV